MNKRVIFLLSCLFFFLVLAAQSGLAEHTTWTIEDENLVIVIEVNDQNLREAEDKSFPLIIDPDERVDVNLYYTVVGDYPIRLNEVKIVFIMFDIESYSLTQKTSAEMLPGSNGTITQSIDLKDYLEFGNMPLVSGIYKLRLEINYFVEGKEMASDSEPFYVRLTGNPITSVMGVVATAGGILTGVSIVSLAHSANNAVPFELDRSIKSTMVSPTDKLMSFYKGKLAFKAQKDISTGILVSARKTWSKERCPSCNSKWPESLEICPKCGISLEEAEEIYSKSLTEKCLKAGEEMSVSVSALNISQIAQGLGEGIPVTTDIIAVLANAGLAFVEPRMGKRLKAPTRRLVFTGLSTSIIALFWIQACSLEPISLYMLIVAILTGIILPIIISKVLDNRIQSAIHSFWKSKRNLT